MSVAEHLVPATGVEKKQVKVDIGELIFSKEAGFYPSQVRIEISQYVNQKGQTIYYTTDGSSPTDHSNMYKRPLSIERSTVLRARVVGNDGSLGPIYTRFYGIGEAPTLPFISIVADPTKLWSEEEGILAIGNGDPDPPYEGANFWNDWETPVYFQWFETNKQLAYEADARMQLFGGESRLQPQKSMSLTAKNKYGVSRFEYSFFPELNISSFKAVVLRNSGQDFPRTHFLDGMVASLMKDTGLDVQAFRPVVTYLNGEYWGIFNLREKISADFLASHHPEIQSKIDLLESDGIVKAGDDEQFLALIFYVREHDLSEDQNYLYVQNHVDLDNFIDYFITEIYIANQDWPDHNIRYWRPQQENGRWRWIVYDSDLSFQNVKHKTLEKALSSETALYPSNELLQKMMEQPQFKEMFLLRFAERMNTTFAPEHVISVIQDIKTLIAPEMKYHLNRWGGTLEIWGVEIKKLEQFALERPKQMRKQIQAWFQLTNQEMLDYGF